MFRLWSEWDIGEEDLIFATREAGVRWLHANEAVKEMAAEERAAVPGFVEALFSEGYFSWQSVEVIE